VDVQALTVGDFNQDGHLDVGLADDPNGVSALLQSTILVSPTSVAFKYPHLVGTTSPKHEVKLANFGSTTILLGTIAVTGPNAGDSPIQNQCGSTLAAGQHCTVGVTFEPSDKNGLSATLSIPNNTLGLGQPVSLFGLGTFAGLSPLSSNCGDVPVGHTSAPQNITLTNAGSGLLNFFDQDCGNQPFGFLPNQ
jgi:hypothetical protein